MTSYEPSGRTVIIPMAWKLVMVDHANREFPIEACGVLAKAQTDDWKVAEIYEMKNVEQLPIGYSMDPKEQLGIERTMRERGQQMLGIYHSHTASEARPSPVDIKHAVSPDIVYVLVSVVPHSEAVVRGFQIDGERVKEDALSFTLD